MKKFVNSDVLVLCPTKFYTENFIKDSIYNIGLNVIDIIYTTDYFKTIDNYLINNYGFSIFIYSNINKTDIYKQKYSTSVYTLYDIYYDYNNLIYNYYNEIIKDNNYKKAIKVRYVSLNSTMAFDSIQLLNEDYELRYYDHNINEYHELFRNSFLPKVYNINNILCSFEPIEPLEVSSIVVENNTTYREDKFNVLDEKLALDNRFNNNYEGYTFIIFNKFSITSIINNMFYQSYLRRFNKQRFVLLLIVNDSREYEELKNDKEISIILEMFSKQLSIVDKKSYPKFISNFIKHLTKDYRNVSISVPCHDKETIDYINRQIFYSSCYNLNNTMHYKAIINNEQEEKLILYLD